MEKRGLYLCEGTSDSALGEIFESLFLFRGIQLRVTSLDFELLPHLKDKTVAGRVSSGLAFQGQSSVPDLIIVHRDSDNVEPAVRLDEITKGCTAAGFFGRILPVIPVRMTEAWLLLDEQAIRRVAGKPNGRSQLPLPSLREVERRSDPKQILAECLVAASETTGRRRQQMHARFSSHRRQLLESLDLHGKVNQLSGWKAMLKTIDSVVNEWHQ
ncbi:thioredoxin domain-containing protein [Actinokineospora bangkokensis]|uniref:hypothetical protein n=1 Tax=Actinokineospora bangkokensis TaxID=1193682 RepID=UPI001E44E54D|nr:hypothetical protein [Actinokineospora bangkokensis]